MLYRGQLRYFAMKKKCLTTIAFVLIFSASFFLNNFCIADVYMYTDEEGSVHIVDNPRLLPKGVKKTTIKDGKTNKIVDFKKELSSTYFPRNKIEEARNATVSIETPLVRGSGFFITEEGYILTNKHVVKGSKKTIKDKENILKDKSLEIRKMGSWLEKKKTSLAQQAIWLSKRKLYLQRLLGSNLLQKYGDLADEYNTIKILYAKSLEEYHATETAIIKKEENFINIATNWMI